MTIAVRTSHVDDTMVDRGIALFTTPMANLDGPPTSVIDDLTGYQAQTRGPGGRPRDPQSIVYTMLGVLIGFYLCVRTSREVSIATAWAIVMHEITPEQRERLGMTGDLTGTRYDVIAAGLMPAADKEARRAAEQAATQEYARFAKVFSEAIDHIDPSVFPRGGRLLAKDRKAIATNLGHPLRRIDVATAQRNEQRLLSAMNKILAVEASQVPEDGFIGDIATDETIVLSHKARRGAGTKEGKWHSADPDTRWWAGKGTDDTEYGFGYGITYIIRMGRPYGKPTVNIPIGIHVGEPTGGTARAFALAHQYADLHGLTGTSSERYAIADQGYTKLDDWVPTLLDLGYKVNADYPAHWKNDREIPDVNRDGNPAPGPRIINGRILCPGAAGMHANALTIPKPAPAPESAKAIVKRLRIVSRLESLIMPTRNGHKRVKSLKGGRPRAGQAPLDLWSITVQCPAALGLVNCINAPRADDLTTEGVPDVPNPPFPGRPHLWPRACLQESVTYRLDAKTIKHLQAEMHGTDYQRDMFETMRSANERFHSQLKHPKGGGITARNWTEIPGIAKRGILFAISTAVTTGYAIDSWDPNREAVNERELERRRRSKILDRLRRTPEVSAGRGKQDVA